MNILKININLLNLNYKIKIKKEKKIFEVFAYFLVVLFNFKKL